MIIEILKEIIEKVVNFIDSHTKAICAFVYLIMTIISILYCNDENRMTILKVMIIIFIAFVLVCIIIDEAKIKIKKEQMPKRRLTKRNANGDIYIPENKINQAIIFLGMLEDELYGKQ